MAIRFIITLLFAVIVTLFAVQNSSTVEISIFFAKYNVSQALVIFVSAILGAIVVLLIGMIQQFKINLKLKNAGKTINQLSEENKVLKQKNEKLAATSIEHSSEEIESDTNIE